MMISFIVVEWLFALIIIDTKLSSISKPTCAINKLLITQFKSTNPTNKSLLPTKRPDKSIPNRPFLVLANRIRTLMDPASPRRISSTVYRTNSHLSSFNQNLTKLLFPENKIRLQQLTRSNFQQIQRSIQPLNPTVML